MWGQAIIVSILLALTSFGGKTAVSFYNVLTLMDNISSTLPYLFLVTAFALFKFKNPLKQDFIFFKSSSLAYLIVGLTDILLVVGIGATVVSSISAQQYWDLFLEIVGPILFGLIGYVLYLIYKHKNA